MLRRKLRESTASNGRATGPPNKEELVAAASFAAHYKNCCSSAPNPRHPRSNYFQLDSADSWNNGKRGFRRLPRMPRIKRKLSFLTETRRRVGTL